MTQSSTAGADFGNAPRKTGGGVVRLEGDVAQLRAGNYVVVRAASVSGKANGWSCACANDGYRYSVSVRGGELVVSAYPPGTMLSFR